MKLISQCVQLFVKSSVRYYTGAGDKNIRGSWRFIQSQLSVRNASTSQLNKNVPATNQRTESQTSLSHRKTDSQLDDDVNEKFKIFDRPLPRSSLVFAKKKKVLGSSEQVIPTLDKLIAENESLQNPDYFHVYNLFTVKDLFEARVHFGHKLGSMHANMRPFIFGSRFDQIIFDLDKTAFHLRQALNFVAHVAYRAGIIMFITRSAQTMHLVEKTAIECGEYAHTKQWDTATLADSRIKFGGITRLPDLVILMSTLDPLLNTHKAVKDSAKMLIPTVAIVDSNCNPNLITSPIPGNDDTPCAVELYCTLFKEAILRGKQKRKVNESKRLAAKDSQTVSH